MIEHRRHDGIDHLRLAHGKANALDISLLGALSERVERLAESPGRGLVLGADGSMFCAGLDLRAAVQMGREDLDQLLQRLHAACRALFEFPRPVVAAIAGHALAGGAILTLACDRRCMVSGPARWGLTEIRLGVSVPGFAVELLRYAVGRREAEHLLYGGVTLSAEQALAVGAIDRLAEPQTLTAVAHEAIEEWAVSPEAFADIKRRLKAPALAAMARARAADESWLDVWFDEETQNRLRVAVEALGRRGRGSSSTPKDD